MDFDCIVIGAGLAGLTASRKLQSLGKSVLTIEAKTQVGGRVRSDRIDGYICDRGFQVINPKYPQVAKTGLLKKLDFKGISGQIRVDDLDINVGYTLGSLSKLSGALTEKLKFARFIATLNVSNKKKFGDYSIDFPNFYNSTLHPFLAGVFLTDPREIAADVVQEILRSFLKSLPGVPAQGVGEFTKALAKPIENLKLGERVVSISNSVVRTNKGKYRARYVIVATDPTTAVKITKKIKQVKMLKSTTAYFSTSEKLVAGKNLVISRRSSVVNSIVISEVSSKYAPAGKSLISATSLSKLTERQCRSELAKLWRSESKKWDLVEKYEIDNSLPLHLPTKSRRQQTQLNDWLFVIGDHMATPSQQGAMNSGAEVADRINQLML